MQDTNSSAEEYVRRIVAPIFKKALQETPKNRLSVGDPGFTYKPYSLWNPHNYRLYVDYNKKSFNPNRPPDPGCIHRIVNSKEHEFKPFEGCRVVVKKTQIELKIIENEWLVVYHGNIDEQLARLKSVVEEKDKFCLKALNKFIKVFGGSSKYQILNRHGEDKVKHEDKIDLLPIKQKWYTPVVKKVYNEVNIEFSSPVFASNYFRNRAIEDIAPDIADAIELMHPYRALKARVKSIKDVLDNQRLVCMLNKKEVVDFEQWVFRCFS